VIFIENKPYLKKKNHYSRKKNLQPNSHTNDQTNPILSQLYRLNDLNVREEGLHDNEETRVQEDENKKEELEAS
jgi:hypothetical protein